MRIQESGENYLEAILKLTDENGSVRSIDVAQALCFSKPSVSIAMKKLSESGYIAIDEKGLIFLTTAGREIAERIYERHKVISSFLIRIGVCPDVAIADACKIEHDISSQTFDCLKNYVHKINNGER